MTEGETAEAEQTQNEMCCRPLSFKKSSITTASKDVGLQLQFTFLAYMHDLQLRIRSENHHSMANLFGFLFLVP